MHKCQKKKNSEKKQPIDSNVIGYLATLLKRLSGLGVTMTTKTWPLGCRTFHVHCTPLMMFSRIPVWLSSNLLVPSVAVLNSDINVIMAIMLEIVCQIGKCTGRKTHWKHDCNIAVHPWMGKGVHACTIRVREVNFSTHCDVIIHRVIAVFHSEPTSFGNEIIDSSEVAARTALPRCVRAVADSGTSCYCPRVIITDVHEMKFEI